MRLRFLLLLALTGIFAGLVGGGLAWLYTHLVLSVAKYHPLVVAVLGGLTSGIAWWLLRRRRPVSTVEHSLDTGLPLGRSLIDAAVQILNVAAGASLGREQAPRQAAAALASALADAWRIPASQRRILLGAAAGAGLAAVYNVPVAGMLFAYEILRLRRSAREVLSVLVVCVIATVTAWPLNGNRPIYQLAAWTPHPMELLAVLTLPAAVASAAYFQRLIGIARRYGVSSQWYVFLSVPGATLTVAGLYHVLPHVHGLTGNGEKAVELALTSPTVLGVLVALILLKPALTALCLASGAVGGTLTPSLALGACTGALLAGGASWGLEHVFPNAPTLHPALFVLLGAACVLAIMHHAPLFAAALTIELTWAPWWCVLVLVPGALLCAYWQQCAGGRGFKQGATTTAP